MLITKGKTNWKFLAIVAVLAIIVGGGVFWLVKIFNPAQPEISIINETANWKTYTNDEYGFNFKYPQGWNFNDDEHPTGKAYLAYIGITSPDNNVEFGITVLDNNSEDLTAKELAEQGLPDSNKITEIEINGIVAAIYEHTNDNPAVYYFPDVYVVNNEAQILIQGNGKAEVDKAIFNKILSTFKFLPVDETAGWQTYRNEKYGFEVKYPKNVLIEGMSEGVLFSVKERKCEFQPSHHCPTFMRITSIYLPTYLKR